MTYTVGVVGCGRWGLAHIRTLLKLKDSGFVDEVYACDIDAKRLKELPDGLDGCFTAWTEMCDSVSFDLIALVTPNTTHVSLGKAILSRGLNVLIEKPLAISPEGVKELIQQADVSNGTLHSGYLLRYHSGILAAKEIIEQGQIGLLKSIRYVKYSSRNKSPPANVIDGLASHALDTVPFFAGVPPKPFFNNITVLNQQKPTHLANADECSLNIQYSRPGNAGDVTVEIKVGWGQNDRSLITVEGSKNCLRLDFRRANSLEIGSLGDGFKPVSMTDIKPPLQFQYEQILSQSEQSISHSQTHLQTAEILRITMLRAESWCEKYVDN